jgi:predicted dehydrogenase
MNRPRFRIGVVGLGKVTQLHHLPALRQIDEFEISAVCDLSREHALAVCRDNGLPSETVAGSVGELLGRDLDAVLIATNHHAPALREAIAAGVPTFVEKPCTWGPDEGRELLALAEDHGVPVLVGYMKRYDPAVERFQADIEARRPFFLRVHNFAGGRHRHERLYPVLKPDASRDQAAVSTENAEVDGIISRNLLDDSPHRRDAVRTLAQLAIHDLNLVAALVGRPDAGTLSSHVTPLGTYYGIDLDAGATRCHIEILADFATSRDWDEVLQWYDADGVAELEFPSPFLRNAPTRIRNRRAVGAESHLEEVMVSRQSPYSRELAHFRDVLAGNAKPRTPLSEAVADLELVYELARKLEAR